MKEGKPGEGTDEVVDLKEEVDLKARTASCLSFLYQRAANLGVKHARKRVLCKFCFTQNLFT